MSSHGRGSLRRGGLGAGLLWLLGACGEPVVDPATEVAAELRALRVAMQAAPQGQAVAAPANVDRTQIVAALSPLRELLDGLVAQQRDLHARQLALTQEMQRWSQLLTETVTDARRAESEAFGVRLQQLEQTLKQQDVRHQEVENLLRGALDRTADRLEQFLRRLEGGVPGAAPTNPAAPAPGAAPSGSGGPPSAGPADPSAPPPSPGGTVEPAPAKGGPAKVGAASNEPLPRGQPRRRSLAGWWLALGGFGLMLGVALWWRRHRPGQASTATTVPHGPRHTGAESGFDQGVEEIWAAAALLGEAVGRLRQKGADDAQGADLPAAVLPPAKADEGVGPDDVFVLDDADEAPPDAVHAASHRQEAAAQPPALAAAAAALQPAAVVAFSLSADDADRSVASVLQVLAEDPRVLRRPGPAVTACAGRVEVRCTVLPGLSAGERSHLEQRIRDAVA